MLVVEFAVGEIRSIAIGHLTAWRKPGLEVGRLELPSQPQDRCRTALQLEIPTVPVLEAVLGAVLEAVLASFS